jgi:hypothetical protein
VSEAVFLAILAGGWAAGWLVFAATLRVIGRGFGNGTFDAAATSTATVQVPSASARTMPKPLRLELAHVPAKWIRFADKVTRQHENLQRFPVILGHPVIQYDREAV